MYYTGNIQKDWTSEKYNSPQFSLKNKQKKKTLPNKLCIIFLSVVKKKIMNLADVNMLFSQNASMRSGFRDSLKQDGGWR